MMRVNVETEPDLRFSTPEVLFAGAGFAGYDPHPDGRFVISAQPAGRSQLHVVLNWFEELKTRVPVP